jgi:hypothetical protein
MAEPAHRKQTDMEILENSPTEAAAQSHSVDQPVRNLGWRVTCTAWTPPVVCIVRVPTRAKAKFKAWDSANDVGYRMKFSDFRVTRAKEYDDAKLIPGRCYGEDFAQSVIPNNS